MYQAQFNVFLQIDNQVVQTATGGETWNQKPSTSGGKCSTTITDKLTAFTNWRVSAQNKKNGLWHLLTNCYPAPGTVGIAWIAQLCKNNGVGISSYTRTHWLVIAHEIGHNIGGNHAFQLGQGKTGGIMDYGDSIYPIGSGIYQFHKVYNEAEM